jgi:hypothetical protein
MFYYEDVTFKHTESFANLRKPASCEYDHEEASLGHPFFEASTKSMQHRQIES